MGSAQSRKQTAPSHSRHFSTAQLEYQSKSLSMCHRSMGMRGRASISFQCFISFGPLLLPMMTPPIFSFGPMWSWSITEIDTADRRIRSNETLNTNDSLKFGSVVFCLVCVFCFSTFLPSCSNQIFTYGSEKTQMVDSLNNYVVICYT